MSKSDVTAPTRRRQGDAVSYLAKRFLNPHNRPRFASKDSAPPSLLRKTRRANQAPLTFDQLRIHGGVGGSSLGSSVALRRASLRACSARVALISRITASRSAASSGSANSPVSSVSGVSLPSSYSARISLA